MEPAAERGVDSCSPIVTLFMSRGTEELVDGLHRVLGSIDFPRQEQTDSIFFRWERGQWSQIFDPAATYIPFDV